MGVYQDTLDKVLKKHLSYDNMKKHLFHISLKLKGIELTEPEMAELLRAIESTPPDDSGKVKFALSFGDKDVVFTTDDLTAGMEELDRRTKTLPKALIQEALDNEPEQLLQKIYEGATETLKFHRGETRQFQRRLRKRWGVALNGLETLLGVIREVGTTFVEDGRKEITRYSPDERQRQTELLEVLVGLHVRLCRTGSEILCLLQSGFADGANARWRSLHELVVVMMFIVEHKGDLPERYLRHGVVERWRSAVQYQEHHKALGEEPINPTELERLERLAKIELDRYGQEFRHDYAWAAQKIGSGKKVALSDLESHLNFSHWRPYYKMACLSVHAGSQALFWSLGIPSGSETPYLAGASSFGLADPGQLTAMSLVHATMALLTCVPNVDSVVMMKVLRLMCDDVRAAFMDIHHGIEPSSWESCLEGVSGAEPSTGGGIDPTNDF